MAKAVNNFNATSLGSDMSALRVFAVDSRSVWRDMNFTLMW